MKRLLEICCHAGLLGLFCLATATPNHASGQTYSEDFEASTVDALPDASGFALQLYGDVNDPAGFLWRTAQDGAIFDDPIGAAGNKSAVMDNNNHGFSQTAPENDGPTNATMGHVWSTNPNNNRVGYIEYDFYLEPAPVDGFTYIDNRLGHRTDGASFVSTAPADTFAWFSLRVNRDSSTGDQNASINSQGISGVGGASVAPLVGETNHLRIDVDNGFHTYTLNDTLIEWDVNGNPVTSLPALPGSGALGVSGMTFVGNFESAPGTPKGLVFIDNIVVDLIPEPATGILAALGGLMLVVRRRTV